MAKRRRQYIVDRSFQLKYTLLISLIGGVISLIFTAWMWDAHRTNTEALVIDQVIKAEVLAVDQNILWVYVAITLLMMAALGLLGVFITHRVAGPAFVMGRYLSAIADGTYPNLRPLRRKDELKEFFTAFEQALESLRGRDHKEAEALEQTIAKLESTGADVAAVATLKEIRDRKRRSALGATENQPE